MIYIGIDPGFSGAFVALNEKGEVVYKKLFPTLDTMKSGKKRKDINFAELRMICYDLSKFDNKIAIMEQVASMPRDGGKQAFSFGRTNGAIESMLAAFQIPYQKVTPQKWNNNIHKGLDKKMDSKQRSMIVFTQLFPKEYNNFFRSDRCKKPHDGLIDALLIAEYGRRNNEN